MKDSESDYISLSVALRTDDGFALDNGQENMLHEPSCLLLVVG